MSCELYAFSVKKKLISKMCGLNIIDFEYYSSKFHHTIYFVKVCKI